MNSKFKIFLMTLISLIAINFCLLAENLEVKAILAGDTQIGGTMPRNVSVSDLTSKKVNIFYKNNTTTDTVYRINFYKAYMDINSDLSQNFKGDSFFINVSGPTQSVYSDTSGVVSNTYAMPYTSGNYFTYYDTLYLKSQLIGPQYWEFGGDTYPFTQTTYTGLLGNVGQGFTHTFTFQPTGVSDIGFDVRFDTTSKPLLTGFTSKLSIDGYSNITKTDGTDAEDNLTNKLNALVYYKKSADFNGAGVGDTVLSFKITHPDFEYPAIADSIPYNIADANNFMVNMRKLKFRIAGIKGNILYSNDLNDTFTINGKTTGLDDGLNYQIDLNDTIVKLYVYASEADTQTANVSSEYFKAVTDLATDTTLWTVKCDTGQNYWNTVSLKSLSNIGNGWYELEVITDKSFDTPIFFQKGEVVDWTISMKYYQSPSSIFPGCLSEDTYYFEMADTCLDLMKIIDLEVVTLPTTQPNNNCASGTIVIDLTDGANTGDSIAILTLVDINFPTGTYVGYNNIDTLTFSFNDLDNGNAAITQGVKYDTVQSGNLVGYWYSFPDSDATLQTAADAGHKIFMNDTVIYKYDIGSVTVKIRDGNDSNSKSDSKALIVFKDLECQTTLTPKHIDDNETTQISIVFTNTGSETFNYIQVDFIDSALLTNIVDATADADTILNNAGNDGSGDWTFSKKSNNRFTLTGNNASKFLSANEKVTLKFSVRNNNTWDGLINFKTTIRNNNKFAYVPDTASLTITPLKANDYLYETYMDTLEIHNLNVSCTIAGTVSNKIDDNDTYQVVLTLSNDGSETATGMEFGRLTSSSVAYHISGVTSSGNSTATAHDTYISFNTFPANSTATCTFSIWTPSLTSTGGDTAWDFYLRAKETIETVDVYDTDIKSLEVKNLEASCTIATFSDALCNVSQTKMLNDSATQYLKVYFLNTVAGNEIDTVVLHFDTNFNNSVDTISSIVGAGSYEINWDSKLIILKGLNWAAGSYKECTFTVTTKDVTVDTTITLDMDIYSGVTVGIVDYLADNTGDTPSSDTFIVKDFGVKLISAKSESTQSTVFTNGETITMTVNFDTNSATNDIDSYVIEFIEYGTNKIDSIIISDSFVSVSNGQNDTVTWKSGNADFKGGTVTFSVSIPESSASTYFDVRVIAYSEQGYADGYVYEASDTLRITTSDGEPILKTITGGKIVTLSKNDTKTFDYIITNPSKTNGIDSMWFMPSSTTVNDSLLITGVEIVGVTGVNTSVVAVGGGASSFDKLEIIHFAKENMIPANTTKTVRISYVTSSAVVQYSNVSWGVYMSDTTVSPYLLNVDTVSAEVKSLSITSVILDKNTVDYNSVTDIAVGVDLYEFGAATAYNDIDSHWTVYYGNAANSYPMTIKNIELSDSLGMTTAKYNLLVTPVTTGASVATDYNIKVVFHGNSGDTLAEFQSTDTFKFTQNFTITDSSVVYPIGQTAIDSGQIVKVLYTVTNTALISDSSLVSDLGTSFTSSQGSGTIQFNITVNTDVLHTTEECTFSFYTTNGDTVSGLVLINCDTQTPDSVGINLANETIISASTTVGTAAIPVYVHDTVAINKIELRSDNETGTILNTVTVGGTLPIYNGTIVWDTVPAVNTTGNTIVVVAYDNSGNTTVSNVVTNLNRDIYNPVISALSVNTGDTFVTDTTSIAVTTTDTPSGILKVEMYVVNPDTTAEKLVETDTTAPYSLTLNYDSAAVNNTTGNTIVVKVYDLAGNLTVDTKTEINKDIVAPDSVVVSGIVNAAEIKGSTTITVASSDTVALGLISLYYKYNSNDTLIGSNNIESSDTLNNISTFTWNTEGLVNDTGYEIYAVAKDVAGNTTVSTSIVGIKVDNAGPIVDTSALPVAGSQVITNQALTFTVADSSMLATKQLQISKNGVALYQSIDITGSTWTYTENSKYNSTDTYTFKLNLTSGDWWYRTYTKDSLGNESYSEWKYFIFINNMPTASDFKVQYQTGFSAAKNGDTIIVSALVVNDNDTRVELLQKGDTSFELLDSNNDKVYEKTLIVGTDIQATDTFILKVTNKNSDTTLYDVNILMDTYVVKPALSGVSAGDTINGSIALNLSTDYSAETLKSVKYYYYADGDAANKKLIESVTTSTEKVVWQTSGITEGYYTVYFEVMDHAGNVESDSVIGIYVDNNRPLISSYTVIYPAGQTAVKDGQSATISVHVVDPTDTTAILTVEAKRGATLLAILTDADGDNVYTANLLASDSVSVANPNFEILATNANGDTDLYASGSVIVDNTIVTPVISGINGGDTIHETVVFNSAVDTDIVKGEYSILVDGNNVFVESVDSLDTKVHLNTKSLPDNAYYTLKLKVWDVANNTAETTVTFFVDNSAPIVTVLTPEQEKVVNGLVNITFTIADSNVVDPANVFITFNNNDWLPVNSLTTYSWSTTDSYPNESFAAFKIKAVDSEGNMGQSALRVVNVDNDNADLVYITSPKDGYITNNSSLNVSSIVNDDNEDSEVEVFLNGNSVGKATNANGAWSLSNVILKQQGNNEIYVVATDDNGNTVQSKIVTIVFDTVAPVFTTSITQNDGITSVNAGSTITNVREELLAKVASYTDTTSIDNILVTYKINELPWTKLDEYDNISLAIPFDKLNSSITSESQCIYIINWKVTDEAGNSSEDSITFTVDNRIKPTIALTTDLNTLESVYFTNDTILVDAAYEQADRIYYTITSLENSSVDTVFYDAALPANATSYTLDVSGDSFPNGRYKVVVTAVNNISNISDTSAPIYYLIDKTPPQFGDGVTLYPGPFTDTSAAPIFRVYRDWASLSLTASDNETGSLKVSVTSNAVINQKYESDSSNNIKIATNLMLDTNEIIVRVTDNSGNYVDKVIKVVYVEPTTTDEYVPGNGAATIYAPDSSNIYIPSGALEFSKAITIKDVPVEEIPTPNLTNDSFINLKVAREFNPEGTIFNKEVRIGIKYLDSDLDDIRAKVTNFDTSNLKIKYWNESEGKWEAIRSQVDEANNIVYGYVTHFSLYAIFYDGNAEGTSKKIYLTHNPVIANLSGLYDGTKGTEFKIDYTASEVASFKVEIFTTRGRKVFSKTVGANSLPWLGLNNDGKYIGSGLYIYKATVVLTNGNVIRKMKPIGVVK